MAGRVERAVVEGRDAIFEESSCGRGRTRVVLALAVLMMVGGLLAPGSAYAAQGKTLAEEEEQPEH